MSTFYKGNKEEQAHLVYLVDDDDDDTFLFKLAFRETSSNFKLQTFSNWSILLETMAEPIGPPNLLIMDLHMTCPDSLEILTNIKRSKQWSHIPVVVLTGSYDPARVRQAYKMGAQTVIPKPDTYVGLLDIVRAVPEYCAKSAGASFSFT